MTYDVEAAGGPDGAASAEVRTGALLAILGGIGYFATLLLHGDLPDPTTAVALEHIAARPEWPLLKLALIFFVLCWVGAFALLSRSMARGTSRVAARLATLAVTVGATLVLVEYSVMGYAVKQTADAWLVADGAEQAELLMVGTSLLGVTGGLFHNFITWLIGLPFFLLALAFQLDGRGPRWMGWLAMGCGIGAMTAGITRFLGFDVVPFPVLYGGFVVPLCLWLAAVGVIELRRSRRGVGFLHRDDEVGRPAPRGPR